ncbi:hypothetical protein GCM10010417_16850 [Streptomyces carpaticus]
MARAHRSGTPVPLFRFHRSWRDPVPAGHAMVQLPSNRRREFVGRVAHTPAPPSPSKRLALFPGVRPRRVGR